MPAVSGNWHADYIAAPAQDCVAIVPSDTSNLFPLIRSIYVGGAGNITLVTLGGTTVTFVGVLVGTILPVCAQQVRATGTTATNLVGWA